MAQCLEDEADLIPLKPWVVEVLCHLIDDQGRNGLVYAVRNGDYAVVERLLNKGVDVSAYDRSGCTVVFAAVEQENMEILKLLLRRGSYRTSAPERYALVHAVRIGNEPAVEILLKHVNIHIALHEACEVDDKEMVTILVQNGADINNRQDATYRTPLHKAAAEGYKELVQLLVTLEARLDIVDREGTSALFRAVEEGESDIVKFLLDHGANGYDEDYLGRDIWMYTNGDDDMNALLETRIIRDTTSTKDVSYISSNGDDVSDEDI